MMIYINNEFKCHTTNPDGIYKEIKTDFFDGKCTTFIEGYMFEPSGKTWTRSDGAVFDDGKITPWKDYNELDVAQREYERRSLAEYAEALKVMGVVL